MITYRLTVLLAHAVSRRDGAVAVETGQSDVPEDDLFTRRIPRVGRFTLIGYGVAHYYMMVAQESAVVDPLKAMLVGDAPSREGPLPATAGEKGQRLEGG